LTPTGRATLSRVIGRAEAAIPLGWDRVVRQAIWRSRYFRICRYSLAVLAADWEVEAIHPFLDPRVLDALAAQGGFGGLGDRNRMMQALFGDLLPPAVVKRPTKAGFDDAMWTDAARRFARAWSGGGLDSGLVDPVCLRDHWLGTPVHALSAPLMQAAWLYDAGLTSS
jgi:asparagine synthase (glutamine-hydrolysing)